MTTTTTPAPQAPSTSRRILGGIRLVAGLELKQRVRSTKWKATLIVVGALIAGVTMLIVLATGALTGGTDGTGDIVFGSVVFFVLFLGLVVSPTLSATSINGDAKEGTLAPLQATGLSATEIVLGKLLASWIASLAFVVVAVPFLVFAYFNSEMNAWAMLTVVLVLAVELLVVCALGLGWSALTSRTASSAVLTYVSVAVITVVMPILFGLGAAVFTHTVTVESTWRNYYDESSHPEDAVQDEYGGWYVCQSETYETEQPRTELTWWMLAINPYVIVADSAPTVESEYSWDTGVLGGIKQGVRQLRLGLATSYNDCTPGLTQEEAERQNRANALSPVWPWGLAVQGALAAGSVWLAVRRTTVPYGKMPSGQRVA